MPPGHQVCPSSAPETVLERISTEALTEKIKLPVENSVPGKPVAHSYGLLSVNYGLLYGIVACYFGLLGVPGSPLRRTLCNPYVVPLLSRFLTMAH